MAVPMAPAPMMTMSAERGSADISNGLSPAGEPEEQPRDVDDQDDHDQHREGHELLGAPDQTRAAVLKGFRPRLQGLRLLRVLALEGQGLALAVTNLLQHPRDALETLGVGHRRRSAPGSAWSRRWAWGYGPWGERPSAKRRRPNAVRSTVLARPSVISSAMHCPTAGAILKPEPLNAVARYSPSTPSTGPRMAWRSGL